MAILCSCGSGGAVPDGADATADAEPDAVACECPALTADDIHRNPFSTISGGGSTSGCPDGETLLWGSCMADSINLDKWLYNTSFYWLDSQRWACGWNGSVQVFPSTNTAVCLLPSSSSTNCTCDPIPERARFLERLSWQEQAGVLAPMMFTTLSSTCEQGVLLGGNCHVEPDDPTGDRRYTSLISAGPTDIDTWACSWNNAADTALTASATAVCLLPDPAEIMPLADRIVRVERTGQLPANNLYVEDAMCELGDFLLWGSCALDNPDASLSDVFLFRSGFVDPTSNAWQCGWYNPTDLTPTVTVTALCLKP